MKIVRMGARRRPAVSPSLREEVLAGLRSMPKTIAPKFFYDSRGAALFEQITEQPEYYPTRTELAILRTHVGEIARLVGPEAAVIEYGSGAGVKIRLLLDALERPVSYTPVDISQRQLADVAETLGRDYPGIAVLPVAADYTRRFELPRLPAHRRRVAFFPGSTIGNFHPVQAIAFLQHVRQVVGPNGALVLGVDRRKDVATLHAAYNDAAGVTAEFNRNVLRRLNRELGATFDLSRFAHRAFFNDAAGRIEMHLESLEPQTVIMAGARVDFDAGETIWTESSYKYDRAGIETLVHAAGFVIERLFTDAADRFWVAVLVPAQGVPRGR